METRRSTVIVVAALVCLSALGVTWMVTHKSPAATTTEKLQQGTSDPVGSSPSGVDPIVGTFFGGPDGWDSSGTLTTPPAIMTISEDGSFTYSLDLPGGSSVSASGAWESFGDRYNWVSDQTGSEGTWFLSGGTIVEESGGQQMGTYTRYLGDW